MSRLGTFSDSPAITGPQLSFLESLTRELWDLSGKITGTDVSDDQAQALASLYSLSKSAASDRISSLKGEILPTLRATWRTMSYAAQTVEAPVSAPELDCDGIYVVAGRYFRVKRSSAGRLYALMLDTDTRRWEYAPGMAAKILPEYRLTAEQASALPFSWCIRCARELTREDSISRKMGAVCYSKSVG